MEKVEEIVISNNTIIKRELEDLFILNNSIVKSESSTVIMLGMINYVTLINLEIINYISNNFNVNLNPFLKYKEKANNIRAMLKEDSISFKDRSIKIEKTNKDIFEEFKKYSKVNNLFDFLVDNLGVYYKDEKIIGNTFLYNKSFKCFKDNDVYEKNILTEYAKNQIQLINDFSKIFKVSITNSINAKKINIVSKDYNVLKPKTEIFKDNINRNICLKILDMISNINYYLFIISNILGIDSTLRYRIAYMIWYSTYNDLKSMINDNYLFENKLEEKEFINILNSQKKFLSKDFRNCMLHYDFKRVINEVYYDKNKHFFGLIEQLFNIPELEFILLIDIYLKRMVDLFEETILK